MVKNRSVLYVVLLLACLLGFFVFVFVYPFETNPRALLDESVLLEVGMVSESGSVSIVQVLDDGTLVRLEDGDSVGVVDAGAMQELRDAIAAGAFVVERESNWARLARVRCEECVVEWILVRDGERTIRVASIEAPRALDAARLG